MLDFIIVGSGISGCNLYWELKGRGKSVHMISNAQRSSSSVAAGVYNPTILKRFTAVWNGAIQLDAAIPHYQTIERHTGTHLLHPIHILRRLHDEREAKTWLKKSHKDDLNRFMVEEPVYKNVSGINADFGFGEVRETGWVDSIALMQATTTALMNLGQFTKEKFDYEQFQTLPDFVKYKNLTARHIVFADGFGMLHNPYFKGLPMQGNKGEVLTIKVPGLQLGHIIKSSVFLMPYKEDLFWVGATYDREDKSYEPTTKGFEFLTSRLERFLKLPYNLVDHKAGIRPTTMDRRPFLGTHKEHHNVHIFNGMGSRAVLVAPWASQVLCDAIYENKPLPPEVDIKRFISL